MHDSRCYGLKVHFPVGSLDRCVEGETARTILSTVSDAPKSHTPHQQLAILNFALQQKLPGFLPGPETDSNK